MTFYPINKQLLVELMEEKKQEQRLFYVPEGAEQRTHVAVKLVRASEGSTFAEIEGATIVVNRLMLETLEYKGTKFTIVSENGVVGRFFEGEL
jgi:co-chaperonin GroES (HSP10)